MPMVSPDLILAYGTNVTGRALQRLLQPAAGRNLELIDPGREADPPPFLRPERLP